MRNQVLVLGQRAVETLEDIQATARRKPRNQPLIDPKQQQEWVFHVAKCARKYVKQNLCIIFV